jgi:hypothetical protein
VRRGKLREEFAPWAGLLVGLVGAAIVHQVGSEGAFDDCARASPGLVLVLGVLGISMTFAAAWASWTVVRNASEGRSRRLVGTISICTATLFVMAMLLPMTAWLVLPACFA